MRRAIAFLPWVSSVPQLSPPLERRNLVGVWFAERLEWVVAPECSFCLVADPVRQRMRGGRFLPL
jgi:hypothetical protein